MADEPEAGTPVAVAEAVDRRSVRLRVGAYAAGLLLLGALRLASVDGGAAQGLGGLVTPLYVLFTVAAVFALLRAGVDLRRVGFGVRPGVRQVVLTVLAIATLRLLDLAVSPLWEALFGAPRDLGRFAGVADSPGALASLLLLSWTVAAFGEEIAYRIVLLRGLVAAFGASRGASVAALLVQAAVFGLAHAYQGPTGVASSATTGLVLGAAVLLGRGSIWPAAIAHGVNNTLGILELAGGG